MKLAIGCDSNALQFKKELIGYIEKLGHECIDFGSEDPIYANVAFKVSTTVASGDYDRGILICGTGIGMSIASNKIHGAYAALATHVYQAQRAQLSNKANILVMGAQVTGIEVAKTIVKEYLGCTFDPESRSFPKVNRIIEYEEKGNVS